MSERGEDASGESEGSGADSAESRRGSEARMDSARGGASGVGTTGSLPSGAGAGWPSPSDAGHAEARSPHAGASTALESVDARVGSFRLTRVIGEGGFGVVYLAERDSPIEQRAALKVIRPGMGSPAAMARFEHERASLAAMDHPHIAHLIDAGTTDRGLPYFVMDFVDGEPITSYCDARRLTVRARLELFVPVCEAVQHAHTKGVIHRDLKPSNILVEEVDGRPHPKVIDFGIAKAVSADPLGRAGMTEIGQFIGTPEYMSPEQADPGATDVDTRSDVYSLGVILYELLAGALPFDPETLRGAGIDEARRIIREDDPPRPSTRLSALGDAALVIADRRGAALGDLERELGRELEWIPLRAMRKERDERYRSPRELADDIENYLAGRVLAAGPRSQSYRARKFIRRHRAGLAGAAAFAVLLAAATTVSLLFAVAANRARGDAERREGEARRIARFQEHVLRDVSALAAGHALRRALESRLNAALEREGAPPEIVEEARRTFAALFERVSATDGARALIDATMLDPAAAAVARDFEDQPLIAANLRATLAETSRQLGLFEQALALQRDVVDARRRLLGATHLDTLAAVKDLGVLLFVTGDLEGAVAPMTEAADGLERALGSEDPRTLVARMNLASLGDARGAGEDSDRAHRALLELRRRTLGDDHGDTIVSMHRLGALLASQGRFDEAEALLRDAADRAERLMPDDPVALEIASDYGDLLVMQERFDEAAPRLRTVVERSRRSLGSDHEVTLIATAYLVTAELGLRRVDEADRRSAELLEGAHRAYGEGHPNVLGFLSLRAQVLAAKGSFEESAEIQRRVLSECAALLGAEHENCVASAVALAKVLVELRRVEEARDVVEALAERTREAIPPGHPHRAELAAVLVSIYEAMDAKEPGRGHAERAARWRAYGAEEAPTGVDDAADVGASGAARNVHRE